MGELVPYGKVWRTGANAATSFVTARDLLIGDLKVPAGSYTIYTVPAPANGYRHGETWTLILNRQIGQWGLVYDPSRDLGRVPMQALMPSSPQQSMTFSFKKEGSDSAEMHIKWELVDEYVIVKVVL